MLAKGQVIDSKSKEVLPQATIIVTDKDGNLIDDGAKTKADKEGYFTIDVFPSDFITISYIGYNNKTVSIKDFSSDVNVIKLKYNKLEEAVRGALTDNGREEADGGVFENKPIKWYYWGAFMLIGYYVYTRMKK